MILLFIVVIVTIVYNIIEIKNRDEEYYLPQSEF
jgi:hypothetical protein